MWGFSEYQKEMKSSTYLTMEFLWNYNLNHWTEHCDPLYLWDQPHCSSMLRTQHMTNHVSKLANNMDSLVCRHPPEEATHCIARPVFAQRFLVVTDIKLFWSPCSYQHSSAVLWEGDNTPNWTVRTFSISFWAHCLPWGRSQSKSSMFCGMLLCTRSLGDFRHLPA